MAKSVTVVLTGDKKVNRMLREISGTQGKSVIRKAARAGIKVVLPAAKRYAPSRTGLLRRNIKVRTLRRSRTRVGARITIGAESFQGKTFYGAFQEWGWRVGKRQGLTKAALATRPKVPGKFFLKRAADSKRNSALIVYHAAIKRGVEEIARKNGAR